MLYHAFQVAPDYLALGFIDLRKDNLGVRYVSEVLTDFHLLT